jgi:putative ATPase
MYWLARMFDAGVDPRYAARRVVRMASEDVGLADPRALRLALDAAEVFERLGSPEGELALAQAVTYLAVAPKSNAVYSAWNRVRDVVRAGGSLPVPVHLRNAPTRLMKNLGHGDGYRYAHDEPQGYAAGEQYLPDALRGHQFYEPVARGLEQRIGERLAELRQLDAAASGWTCEKPGESTGEPSSEPNSEPVHAESSGRERRGAQGARGTAPTHTG